MTNYSGVIKQLENDGYVVGGNTDGSYYWSTYSTYNDGFETEEEAWMDAWTGCNERGYND